MNIHISNISPDVTDSDVQALFSPFGKIESVEVIRNIHTGESMGYAFVVMALEEEANNAITTLDATSWMGKEVTVTKAKRQNWQRKPRRPSFQRSPR